MDIFSLGLVMIICLSLQTLQTKFRLLEKQSDQGLPYLQFSRCTCIMSNIEPPRPNFGVSKIFGLLLCTCISSVDNYSEDLLEKHECEVARLKEYYDAHEEILSKIGNREELFNQMIEFEVQYNMNS